jgi:hypothetical protein
MELIPQMLLGCVILIALMVIKQMNIKEILAFLDIFPKEVLF